MEYINKISFINYLSCPTLGWMAKRSMIPKLNGFNNELLMLEGKNIHKLSLQLSLDAVNARKLTVNDSIVYTKELILNPDVKVICDASFAVEGYSARVDILQRLEDGLWHLLEVKSGSKYKAKYINDMSFISMVLAKLGVNLSKIAILHLSKDYRIGMSISQLFEESDCTEKVKLKSQEFLALSDKAFKDIESENMPQPCLKRKCKNCPVFNVCMGKDVQNHIFDLPGLSILTTDKLVTLGADTIDQIPPDFELTEMQKIVKDCVLTNTTYISKNLKTELKNIKPPFYYLDFESISAIMPLYKDIAPHTQLLTQFSIDRTDEAGNILNHYEYIADHTKNCRREIAEKLIEYLGINGSIITYANFERIAIHKLAKLFPDLSINLKDIAERNVDIELIVRKNYYDINFHGRSSIKKILPVLIPEMDYTSLAIRDGGDAAAVFVFMAMGLFDAEKIEETKKNLLKYCAQDTLAMVKIHQFLINAANCQ